MILASGPGPNPVFAPPPYVVTPDDLLNWVWIGACCALLLLAEVILAYHINRKQGTVAWRHPFVVLPLVACVFAAAVSVYAWTLYQPVSAAVDPSKAAAHALGGFLPFGVAVLIGTLALLAAGAVAALLPDDPLILPRSTYSRMRGRLDEQSR